MPKRFTDSELFTIYQAAAIQCAYSPSVENLKEKLVAYRAFREEFLR